MATKNIIKIDREKCIGCGQCVNACHNSAIDMVDGKAMLVREPQCDGLGACIGQCPVGALTIEQKEVAPQQNPAENAPAAQETAKPFVCPGSMAKKIGKNTQNVANDGPDVESALTNWPIQLKLVNPEAPFFRGADLLIAADCTAFALGGFHKDLLASRQLMIACPKLDDRGQYIEKLKTLFEKNRPASVTLARMQVPCCKGLLQIVYEAMALAEVNIPFTEVIISLEGEILDEHMVDDSLLLARPGV